MADQNVVRAFRKAIRVRHAGPKVQKALFEAGITESNLRNLNYGDRDSKGALQQRASTGWKHATDPYRAALDFLAQAQPINQRGFKGSAGQLAQAVQRSAFPGRYDQNASQAAKFLQGQQGSSPGGSTTTTTSTTGLSPDALQGRRALLAQFVLGNGKDPVALAQGIQALNQTQTTTKVRTSGGTGPSAPSGAAGNFKSIFERAVKINGAQLPYKWGGGHGGRVDVNKPVPLDCSGAVSAVLGIDPRVSGAFSQWGKPGRGRRITVYSNSHHVLMEIDGHFFGTSHANPGGGAGWIPRRFISAEYLRGFTARHL